MNYIAEREQLVAVSKSLFDRGYSVGGAGNISLRLNDGNFLCTPTGSSLGRLDAQDLSLLDANGDYISGKKPSKEFMFHYVLYQEKPDIGALVHLHSTYLTALSCLDGLDKDNLIKAFTPYFVMRIGHLAYVPYQPPGSLELVEAIRDKAKLSNAFLLANHGSVVVNKTLIEAVNDAEELEETAKLKFILANHNVRYLTDLEVDFLRKK